MNQLSNYTLLVDTLCLYDIFLTRYSVYKLQK